MDKDVYTDLGHAAGVLHKRAGLMSTLARGGSAIGGGIGRVLGGLGGAAIGGTGKAVAKAFPRHPLVTAGAVGLGAAAANEGLAAAGNTAAGKELGIKGFGGVDWNPGWQGDRMQNMSAKNPMQALGTLASRPIQTAMNWFGNPDKGPDMVSNGDPAAMTNVKYDPTTGQRTFTGTDKPTLRPSLQTLQDQITAGAGTPRDQLAKALGEQAAKTAPAANGASGKPPSRYNFNTFNPELGFYDG